jgi:uncharacterized SAM-binding protein YcdF (DUF218 family)
LKYIWLNFILRPVMNFILHFCIKKRSEMNENLFKHILKLWDYHNINESLKKADFILVMGSADDRVATQAGYLFLLNYSDLIITSGGFGKITKNVNEISEGEKFALIIEGMRVPKEKIIIENEATNSGENLKFTKLKLKQLNLKLKTGILVTKPYMKRRAYATAKKQWPEIEWQVSAPNLSFENYLNDAITFDMTVNLMVGDLQRIKIYAEKGFQIEQNIPDDVWESYEFLKNKGFNKYVIE